MPLAGRETSSVDPTTAAYQKEHRNKKHCMRIVCPHCGNDHDFIEVADDVIITTRYLQNNDCSFNQAGDESQVMGDISFFCGECNADLTLFHPRFLEMLF
jgi:hypothetical protein